MTSFDALNLPKTDSDTYPFEGDELIRIDADVPCLVCGNPTHWVSLSFEAPFCSDECLRSMWQGYEAAQAQFNDLPTPEKKFKIGDLVFVVPIEEVAEILDFNLDQNLGWEYKTKAHPSLYVATKDCVWFYESSLKPLKSGMTV